MTTAPPTKAERRAAERRKLMTLALMAAGALSYVLVFTGRSLLSDKYFRDSFEIQYFMGGLRATGGDWIGIGEEPPDASTARLFNRLGLYSNEHLVGVLAITMYVLLVLMCISRRRPSVAETGIVAVGFVLAGVYMGVYSKEFFVVPLVLAFTYAIRRGGVRWELAWIGLAAVYGAEFRANWIAVPVIYVALRLTLRLRFMTVVRLAGCIVLGTVVLSVIFPLLGHSDLHYHRYDVVEGLSADINTEIHDPATPGSIPSSVINGVYSFVTFLFPFPLLRMGESLYIAAAGFFAVVWSLLLPRLRAAFARRGEVPTAFFQVMALLLATTYVQSLYAPDWSSYLRHMTPLIPLFALALRLTQGVASHEALPKADTATLRC